MVLNKQQEVASVSDHLKKSDGPFWQQAYSLPKSIQELQSKRYSFFRIGDEDSVFASGWVDYAHALLAGWYGHREIEPFSGLLQVDLLSKFFQNGQKNRKVITTSLRKIIPLQSEQSTPAPVIEHGPDGILIRGKQNFALDAQFADELMVFLREVGEEVPSTAVLIPVRSENLVLQLHSKTAFSLTVSYENVFVPWNRILIYRNANGLGQLLSHPLAKSLADYQWVARQLECLELVIGTAFALAEDTGLHQELHIQGDLGELIQGLETMKALIHIAEIGAEASLAGIYLPAAIPLEAAKKAGSLYYSRAMEVLHRIGSGAILDAPYVFQSESRETGSQETLLQLVLRLAGSENAIKRKLHEQYSFGDPIHQSAVLYRQYPVHVLKKRYEQFWLTIGTQKKLIGGEENDNQDSST